MGRASWIGMMLAVATGCAGADDMRSPATALTVASSASSGSGGDGKDPAGVSDGGQGTDDGQSTGYDDDDDDDDGSDDDGAGGDVSEIFELLHELIQLIAQHECQCYASVWEVGVDECIANYEGYASEESTCLIELAESSDAVLAYFECELDAFDAHLACLETEQCLPPLQCDETTLAGIAVCDGYADCSDGSDEQPGCTPGCVGQLYAVLDACPLSDADDLAVLQCKPVECEDGTRPGGTYCDGVQDCADGSDEANCN